MALQRTSTARSAELMDRAQNVIPGGVNSPARSFRAVGGTPRFIASAGGPYMIDVDGNRLVDYVCSWGALLLGHAHPDVVYAITKAAATGTTYGAPTENEVLLAELICHRVGGADSVRLTSSGTEATMTAIRLARGFTRRDHIVRFDGCYHGHADTLLAGGEHSPGSGIPEVLNSATLLARYNDSASVAALFEDHGANIAAVIVEPVAANMGVVAPVEEFHSHLRDITHKHGALLIHDEVITGFRLSPSGWNGISSVRPDLFTFGKVIGGGLPVGGVAGRREVMDTLAPLGPVFQAGTLSGNPLAVAAGLRTLELATPQVYTQIQDYSQRLQNALENELQHAGVPYQLNALNGLFSVHFADTPISDYASAQRQSTRRYAAFFHALLERNVYAPPSPFEAWFASAAHDDQTLAETISALPAAVSAAAAA